MGCHKCSAITSFQDRVQGEDSQQRRDIRLFQVPMTAHCKSPLFGQTMDRRGRVKTESSLRLLGWELKVVIMIIPYLKSPCERKAIGFFIICVLVTCFQFVARAMYLCTKIK